MILRLSGTKGFFYLSASPAVHGWRLPAELPASNGTTLVVTRADARQKAIDDDHKRAGDAIMLGPSDPALTVLVKGLRERVEPEMWQGAVLGDRSEHEDYTLFVYECDIIEGSEHSSKQRPRKSTLSWLVRVSSNRRCTLHCLGHFAQSCASTRPHSGAALVGECSGCTRAGHSSI